MTDRSPLDQTPWYWPINELIDAYASARQSPADLTERVLGRIATINPELHAYVTVTAELARQQAEAAAERYRRGDSGPLLGVPVSIKDCFDVADYETTLGSLTYRGRVVRSDSGAVARLRHAGAVFVGKTNVPEFCQSSTTENLLGPDTGNPWDPSRTPGGSSGGAAASVASGLATAALGSDGGGSIRIPAAFCGLVGFKPTTGLCADERGFRALTDFSTVGPITWRVHDARLLTEILAERRFARADPPRLRVGFCPRPEDRPVDPAILDNLSRVADTLADLGHDVTDCAVPADGWQDIFRPLALDDELRERQHLLDRPEPLTKYQLATLRAAVRLNSADVTQARTALDEYRQRMDDFLQRYDIVLTPTTATVAFPHRQRPETIAGTPVDRLWGAFPFTAPFSVAGVPAITVPTGVSQGLPIGAQLVARRGQDEALLNIAESLEAAVTFDHEPVRQRWMAAGGPGERASDARN